MSGQSDRLLKNQGSREYAAGVALPLWLPGERDGTVALAEAESRVVDSRTGGARLRLAGQLRTAWWAWQGQQAEHQLAQARLESASRLAADVGRRVRAGDLARADQHQAEGARASAAAAVAESERALAGATRELRSIVGGWPDGVLSSRPSSGGASPPVSPTLAEAEPLPALPEVTNPIPDGHPALVEWRDRAELARHGAELARLQTRGNPELVLSTARERGAFEEGWQRNLTVGVRIPFGSEARHQARLGLARAEALEAERLGQLEQERLEAAREASQYQVEAVRRQLEAAIERARLAAETRQFFDKSFRLGESDLPTRLRVELEAVEAERQAARARIALAAAISDLRQALGLLPE
jgi:cobalt-zinc-cadmium efflux system outer membrane protein